MKNYRELKFILSKIMPAVFISGGVFLYLCILHSNIDKIVGHVQLLASIISNNPYFQGIIRIATITAVAIGGSCIIAAIITKICVKVSTIMTEYSQLDI